MEGGERREVQQVKVEDALCRLVLSHVVVRGLQQQQNFALIKKIYKLQNNVMRLL